jgi:uncharacterized protein (TIGR00369 family)
MRLNLEDDGHCFVCGRNNSSGLKLDFREEDGRTVAEFVPGKAHQGFRDIVHGGIIAAVLDEAVMKTVLAKGIEAVTAEITVRFRSPLAVGERARVEAGITKSGGRLFETSAVVVKSDGTVAAEARTKLLRNG